MSNALSIRQSTPDDIQQIRQFILELAIYEKAEHEVEASEADLHNTLFGEGATAHCIICENEGVPIGFAVTFLTIQHGKGVMDSI